MNAECSHNTPKGSKKTKNKKPKTKKTAQKGRTFVFCWPSGTMHLGKNSGRVGKPGHFSFSGAIYKEHAFEGWAAELSTWAVPRKGFSDPLQQRQKACCLVGWMTEVWRNKTWLFTEQAGSSVLCGGRSLAPLQTHPDRVCLGFR